MIFSFPSRIMIVGALALALALALAPVGAAVPPALEPASPGPPELLTNLFQLRQCAGQKPLVQHPFRIVADVLDVAATSGVVVLRDDSGVEFLRLGLQGRQIESGASLCLQGSGCGVRLLDFGLAIDPGMVVDNDGVHGLTVASGTRFLHAGFNPITVQWFNRLGDFGMEVEYEGPGLPRQRIPASALARGILNPATGVTNFSAGLDYHVYEGFWGCLPDFAGLNPVKSGVATNLDLAVRTRDKAVGIEFNGFITIRRAGFFTFQLSSDDGSRLLAGQSSLDYWMLNHGPAPRAAGQVPATLLEKNGHPWVTLEGTVKFAGTRGAGQELEMQAGAADIRVEIFAGREVAPNFPPDATVQVSGIYQDLVAEDGSQKPGLLKVSSWQSVRLVSAPEANLAASAVQAGVTNPLASGIPAAATTRPALAVVAEIKALPLAQAARQLPVSIRGVVTAILPAFLNGLVLQDSTKGIYVSLQDVVLPKPLPLGELCQIDGVTGPGMFAPIITAHRITPLGEGAFPPPVNPRREQLFDGSLDTQYVEIEGVVTAVHDHQLVMLTESGPITLVLDDFEPPRLAGYEHAQVRIRGCAFAFFNQQTHELDTSSLRVMGGAVEVLQPAPSDLFDAPHKSICELLRYDPKTAPLRRLVVSGQIIHGRAGECFLTDGTNGLRVTTRNPEPLAAGDLVEAAGFLELEGLAVELKEAVIRKTGCAPLPAPTLLTPDHLLLARNAGRLVQVEATLVNQWREGSKQVLWLQSGFLTFRAQIDSGDQRVVWPPPGSRLQLTGAYSPQGDRAGDGTVSGFELLLNSPAALRVLATPPWWTLKRMFVLAGILALLLGAVVLWNKELQLQVQERGHRLEMEIHHRQRAELQRSVEADRSRISRDLHDALGTDLTEMSLLANAGLRDPGAAAKNHERFHLITGKCRALVSDLDLIIWAINPKHDSLQSFADYLEIYAEELFSAAGIICRFKIPIEFTAASLNGPIRHSLLLAVMEALNNIIRHASAREVELKIAQLNGRLEIVIADNGCGFDPGAIRAGDGLRNLHERMQGLDGNCRIESGLGKGTTIALGLPLADQRRPAGRPD
jgi:signal transduction histidine kinase